jgi:hypothetical protein
MMMMTMLGELGWVVKSGSAENTPANVAYCHARPFHNERQLLSRNIHIEGTTTFHSKNC